ncbi:FAD/NAD(P)-binding oxidoreductase [Deinococcus malanensis]|uniref:NAD(P)/FAD-dependent oxidoreductase n=1 Tax=Deinococcus malanensis TaxID=1706855 RepID=UPI00362DA178
MTRPRFIVIGADAAGMSAASEARRVNPHLEIIAFDKGNFVSYSQCGMPYWLGGVVERREQLMARSVEGFARRDIHVHVRHEVVGIDTPRQTVRVRDLEGGREFDEPYDRLLIATGASPVEFPCPGAIWRIFYLDVLEDAIRIDAYLREQQPRCAVVVGGGYVGLEMAENLTRRGLKVALVQRGDQVFHAVDLELAQVLHAELERHGVDLSLGEGSFRPAAGRTAEFRKCRRIWGTWTRTW